MIVCVLSVGRSWKQFGRSASRAMELVKGLTEYLSIFSYRAPDNGSETVAVMSIEDW